MVGQVDITNQVAFMGQLLALDGAPTHLTVDLREVSFVSFAALHVLVTFAVLLDPDRRLVVHTKSPAPAQMLRVCGWDRPAVPITLLEEIDDD
nr:STAS domain-containing protein [Streptomyces coryli]